MSMISEHVKELRKYAGFFKDDRIDGNLSSIFKNAADTIEALSAKLQAANMEQTKKYYNGEKSEYDIERILNCLDEIWTFGEEPTDDEREAARDAIGIIQNMERSAEDCGGGWIACEDRFPNKYCHCLVTRRNDYEDGFDTDVREDVWIELEGVWDWQSKHEGLMDNIIAWQPLPEPYRP